MPFQSEKQRRFLHANHPEIAKRWERNYFTGGVAQLNSQLNQLPEYYLPKADGGQLVRKSKKKVRSGYGGPQDWGQEEKGTGAYDKTDTSPKGNNGVDNREKYIAEQYTRTTPKTTTPPDKDDKPEVVVVPKEKKKKTDLIDKTLTTVDNVDKLYRFGTTLNPLNLYKTNPYILGGTILKSLFDKNKKKKTEDDQVKTILTGDKDITVASLNTKEKIEYNKLINKKIQNEATDGMTPPLNDDEKEKLNELEKKKSSEVETDKMTMIGAKGGIANHFKRKKLNEDGVVGDALFRPFENKSIEELQLMYPQWDPNEETLDEHIQKLQATETEFAGVTQGNGILDTEESEMDVTTEETGEENPEGELINLFAENTEDAGVPPTTLFMNSGGISQLVKQSPDGKRPGYGGPQDWGQEEKGTGAYSSGADQEDDVATMESDMGVTTDNSPDWTGSDRGWVESEDDQTAKGGSDYIGPTDEVRIHNEIKKKKEKWDSNAWMRGVSTVLKAPKPTGVFWVDIPRFIWFGHKENEKKKERIAEIDADLAMLDKIGATKHHHSVDTIYQKLTQEKLDLTQPRRQDDDSGGDDGMPSIYEPPSGEQEDYYASYITDYLGKIREKQSLRASLKAKDIIKDNEIVTDDITMTLNKGGLASLFRVKNQY